MTMKTKCNNKEKHSRGLRGLSSRKFSGPMMMTARPKNTSTPPKEFDDLR